MGASLNDGIDLLLSSGLAVEVKSATDAEIAGRKVRIRARQNPPSPSMVEAEREDRVVVYVVPRVTDSLARQASADSRLAVVATDEGVVWWNRQRHQLDRGKQAEKPQRGRTPWARLGLLRALTRTRRPRTQAELALEIGQTQAAVSQNLQRMRETVTRTPTGWATTDPSWAIDTFLAEYPGVGGIAQYWYGIDSIMKQADIAALIGNNVLYSGDAAADVMIPWRTPRKAVVYSASGLQLAAAGFAESKRDTATLTVKIPIDPSIWPLAKAYNQGKNGPATVDPLLCAVDVRESGGSDWDQAVAKLTEYAIERWHRDY